MPDILSISGRFGGTGPGSRTKDGCSVDLYLRLPYRGEVELVEPWLPANASVLELGCGVGRITRQLLAKGFRVTAVDNSPEMLAHLPEGPSKICADIESLSLGQSFDAVLLASCLINIPDSNLRRAQLTKCRVHLRAGGVLFFERYDPAWLSRVTPGYLGNIGEIEMHVDEIHRTSNEVEMCCRYLEAGKSWQHYFAACPLEDTDIRECFTDAGFEAPIWINRRWGRANVREDASTGVK